MYIELDKSKNISLSRQIYEVIRSQILTGRLTTGEKLPSSRELSASLKVSRNVVLRAYELLELEGFIIIREKSGTYVAEGAHMPGPIPSPPATSVIPRIKPDENYIDLRSGIPTLDMLPRRKWSQLHSNLFLDTGNSLFGYGEPNGLLSFRSSISGYLKRVRGLDCDPGQIIITNGSVHSFSLLSSLLLEKNDLYIIEDPLHEEIRKIFLSVSHNFKSVSADYNGMQTRYLDESWSPGFIFVTPSHQYPLGGCLSIQRRIDLVQYAKRKHCYIIEDDYDSEFRYGGAPVSTLYNLAPDRVIYAGTFSKTFCPALRLGYLILPDELIKPLSEKLHYRDYFTNTITQLVMEQFLEHRILENYIRRVKKIYERKRNHFILRLKEAFQESIVIHGDMTGLHFIAEFKSSCFDDRCIEKYNKLGLGLHPVWKHSAFENYPKNSLIIGYSHLSFEQIDRAAVLLALENGLP